MLLWNGHLSRTFENCLKRVLFCFVLLEHVSLVSHVVRWFPQTDATIEDDDVKIIRVKEYTKENNQDEGDRAVPQKPVWYWLHHPTFKCQGIRRHGKDGVASNLPGTMLSNLPMQIIYLNNNMVMVYKCML